MHPNNLYHCITIARNCDFIAGLPAQGQMNRLGTHRIKRGYHNLITKLTQLGAQIRLTLISLSDLTIASREIFV